MGSACWRGWAFVGVPDRGDLPLALTRPCGWRHTERIVAVRWAATMQERITMGKEQVTRRDFHKLSLAALGGAVSGAMMAGCSQEAETPTADPHAGHDHGPGEGHAGHDHGPGEGHAETASADASPFLSEPNVCRGLNDCKGKGQGGNNDCAGMSTCHTASKHGCHTHNDCRGQGGCGETAGGNDCKGQGKCGVPLKEKTWKKARVNFEAAMKSAGRDFGQAPVQADG